MYKGKEFNIFICYRGRKDGQGGVAGALLYKELNEIAEFKPFYANAILKEGVDDFKEASRQALEDVKVFILLLTPEFFDDCSHHDDMVKDEIQTALGDVRIQFIPISLPGFDAKQGITKDVRKLFGVDFENRVMHKSPIAWNDPGKFEIKRKLEKAIDKGFEKYDKAKDSKNTPAKDAVETDTRLTIKGGVLYKCDKGVQGDIIIPNGVTSINRRAFLGCDSLISVTIPDSVTSIGGDAFYGCDSIESITIPFVGEKRDGTGATNFGYIFGASDHSSNCDKVPESLKSVVITGGDSIEENAFEDCTSLASITIPDSVTSIESYAFASCVNLKSLVIPESVKQIANNAFAASGLTEITLPSGLNTISEEMFYNCKSLTSVTIPNSVTSIYGDAFSDCISLASVAIPDSVSSIGEAAFECCASLTSVTIPGSVTSIGADAFHRCTSLGSVTILPGRTSTIIKERAFMNCVSLTSVTIPDSVTSIANRAFQGCISLSTVDIPRSADTISDSTFEMCECLKSVSIPNGVKSIHAFAFRGCRALTSVTIPDSVTSIGSFAFARCAKLKSLVIPESVKLIGDNAFAASGLTEITLPSGLNAISNALFYNCQSLTSVIIGKGVTSIGWSAFGGCTSLASVTFDGTTKQWKAVDKGLSWKDNCPFTEVVCSDGMVPV